MAGRGDESFAHAPPFGRFDGDVLQIGVVAAQPPRHRHRLRVVGVDAAGARQSQLRQLVGVGAFELGNAAMLQNFGRQREVFRQLFQHFFVGAARAGGGFFDDGHAQFVKKDFTQLFGAAEIEGLTCDFIGLVFQLDDALPQLVALGGQHGRVDQHAVALDTVQRLAAGDFQLVDKAQFVVFFQLRPQRQMHVQRLVGVFARIFGGFVDIDLVKTDLARAFAAQVLKADAGAPQVALGQAAQSMLLVHLQHIALQHGVVGVALHFDAVVGKDVAVVLDVLAELFMRWVFQPGFELGQHLVARQLLCRAGVDVRHGNISRLAGCDAQADADNFGAHLVQ